MCASIAMHLDVLQTTLKHSFDSLTSEKPNADSGPIKFEDGPTIIASSLAYSFPSMLERADRPTLDCTAFAVPQRTILSTQSSIRFIQLRSVLHYQTFQP